jgi:CTP:molybdopterin cytidylyltransferase MocA
LSQAAVVLAAGAGSRFHGATHKLLAGFRGRPLVLWAVGSALGAVGAGIDAVAVVSGAAELAGVLPPGVTLLINEGWASGQAGSLRAGLDWCLAEGHGAAVVGLADQPLVPSAAWSAVATAGGLAPIVAASYGGRRRNPVRLDRSVWPLLPTEGDEGARALMRRHPEMVAEVACEGDPADVDTLEDLRQWS